MKRNLKFLFLILFLLLLFNSSIVETPGRYLVEFCEIINLSNNLNTEFKVNLSRQEYLLKIKYQASNSKLQGIYLNKVSLPLGKIKRRGIIETNYFKVPKDNVKDGLNFFGIGFLNAPPREIDFRIRNFQKKLFNSIYIFFDSTIKKENFDFNRNLKNSILLTLFFSFFFYVSHRIKKMNKHKHSDYSNLSYMLPTLILLLAFRVGSLATRFNIYVTPHFLWSLSALNFCIYIPSILINILDLKFAKNKSQIKINLFRFIAIGFVFIFFIVLGEFCTRIYKNLYLEDVSIFKISDYSISYLLRPNFKGAFADANVSINSYGFRNREVGVKKNLNIFRILCLGDSITFGYGVDNFTSFPSSLERLLNTGQKKYEVINAAITGYNTAQERILLEQIGLNFHPDFVIIGFCSNDITSGLHIPTMFGSLLKIGNDPYRVKDMNFLTWIEYNLVRRSFFYQYILLKFQALARKYNWFKEEFVKSYPKSIVDYFAGIPNTEIKKREENFKKELLSMKELADKNKFKLLLVAFPTLIQLEDKNLRKIQETLGVFCKQYNIYYLDLIPLFSRFKRDEIFIKYDQDHLNVEGHKLVASEIYNIIKNIEEGEI